MTTNELIARCFYDKLNAGATQYFLKRCYSLDITLERVNKEYQKLEKQRGK